MSERTPHEPTPTPPLAGQADAELSSPHSPDGEFRTTPQSPEEAEQARRASRAGRQFPAVPGYEILEELGHGGMGVVYKAVQTAARRTVALKMILVGDRADESDRLRFKAEAEAMARVQHPGVVQVFEVSEHQGQPFFSMEFCPGGSLAHKLAGTPLPPPEAAEVVRSLAEAVQAAHAKGVLHRDLKPANVLLTENGQPKVCDFGLAKKLDDAGQTVSGAVMGTPSYMAPEQAGGKGARVGAHTDVYGLGAVLYECLTGRPPFKAATLAETLMQVVADEPAAVRQLNPVVPRDLETVCHKCLEKDAGKRYESAATLAAELGRFLAGEPVAARPVGWGERCVRWCRRNPVVAGLLGVVVTVLLGATVVATGLTVHADAQLLRANERDAAAAREADLRRQAEQALGKAEEAKARSDIDSAVAEEQRKKAEAAEEKNARYLAAVQLMRVDSVYERDPGRAKALLYDVDAIPIALRDTAWRFYERACDRWELASLRGHTRGVTSVAYSPDGQTLATASDREVRLWHGRTGQFKATLDPRTEWRVYSVAFSPDGQTLATALEALDLKANRWIPEVWLWDVGTRLHKVTLKGHSAPVLSVAFSPDGLTLASATTDRDSKWKAVPGEMRLWDAKTGQPKATLEGHTGAVRSVAFSPDGRTLATASSDRTVRLWDAETGQTRAILEGHTYGASSVAYSPDGRTLASASGDVRLWDLRSGQPKAIRTIDTSGVTSVALSPDGLSLAGSDIYGKAGEVRVWDVKTGQRKATLSGHTGSVSVVAYSPDGRTLVSASRDGTVRLWDARTGQTRATLEGHPGGATSVAFSPDGKTLASASGGLDVKGEKFVPGEVRLWDARTGQNKFSLRGHAFGVTCVAYSPDGQRLVSASGVLDEKREESVSGELRLWDIRTGQSGATLTGHTKVVHSVAYSPDGLTLASGSYDQSVRLWDAKTGQHKATLLGHTAGVYSVAYSPDGQTLASAYGDTTVRLWDLKTGQPKATLQGLPADVYSVAFSPDGQTLASAAGNGENVVRLWDIGTGPARPFLPGYADNVSSVAFSPDGQTLATGSGDESKGEVRLWDGRTGQLKATLPSHASRVTSVGFSPDGRRVFSLDEKRPEQEQLAWTIADGKPAETDNSPPRPDTPSVAVSPDGSLRAEARSYGVVLIDTAAERHDREERLALEPVNRIWWHQVQADRAEVDGEWFAAAFHLKRLLKDRPDDADLLRRRDEALKKLSTVLDSPAPPRMDKLPADPP